MSHHPATSTGLTLLELLVVLAIVSVVAAIGAPPLEQWLARQRVAVTLQSLQADLQRARHEAVLRNRPVVLCGSGDGRDCAPGAWPGGWIVFVNDDDDRPARRDAGEALLAVQAGQPRVALASNRAAYAFRGDLRRATNGSVIACDTAGGVPARLLVVSFTGRARIAPPGAPTGSLTCP